MRDDTQLQHDVQEELEWEPSMHAFQIGVTVKDGVVTLTGYVDRFAAKMAAERVAKGVDSIKVVVNDIDVRISPLGPGCDGRPLDGGVRMSKRRHEFGEVGNRR